MSDINQSLLELAWQYLGDTKYPPGEDIRERQIAQIKAVLDAVERLENE